MSNETHVEQDARPVLGANGVGVLAELGQDFPPLESLVMARPDAVVDRFAPVDQPALARQTYAHPALRATLGGAEIEDVPDRCWICGAPFTVEAVRLLSEIERR